MDGDLLVGPMELRPDGEMIGVLDVLKGAFDVGLIVKGLDDVGGGLVVPVGHQDADPERFFEFGPRRVLDGEGQLPGSGFGFGERPFDQVFNELAIQDLRDSGLNLLAGLFALRRGVDGLLQVG